MLAFLVGGHSGLIKDFLSKKTKFAAIFHGLTLDSPATVSLVLSTLKSKLIENVGVSKTSKMKIFSVNNLKPLIKLLEWKVVDAICPDSDIFHLIFRPFLVALGSQTG